MHDVRWPRGWYERFGKRVFDLAGAALLVVLLAPLMGAVALAVLWRLGPPVLFVQARAGRGGVSFRLLKFRSMREGPGDDAARLDGFGRTLRRWGLDELPQLANVLRGEMSLVGPRPLPPDYVARYSARQALRLRLRPGLAGAGVAAGRNALSWADRLERDAAHAAGPLTLSGDLRLLGGTLRVWLAGQGASAPGHPTMPAFTGTQQAEAEAEPSL
jgi:lipopolysaccharide/colanic/teichoic acid biosynthesis glycosyltransferase